MKRIISVIVSLLLSIAIVGCGSNNNEPSRDLDELGYNPFGLPIVQQEVTYRIISPKNALADNYNDMLLFQNMRAQTNVNIIWENLGEESFQATRNLILADTRNLPDAMYHAGFSDRDIIQYSAAKTILAFDNYLDYMPNLKRILAEREDIRRVITAPDGHIYALPRVEEMGLLQYPNLLFLNKAWVNKLSDAGLIKSANGTSFTVSITGGNLAENSTYENIVLNELNIEINGSKVDGFRWDQYEAILKAMKDNASFLTNAQNIIPMTFRFGGWQGNQSDLYAAFGVPENIDHRTIVDNQVVFTATTQKFKQATNEIASWISKGLIEQDVFVQGEMEFLAKGKGNDQRLGSFYWWEKETVIKPEWQADYVAIPPLISPDGQTQMIGVSNNQEISKGNFVVFSKAQNPEILMTWIDRFYDPVVSAQVNYGPIGIVYEEELTADGRLIQKPIPDGMTADELRLKNSPMGVIYLSYEQWEKNLVMEYRARLRLEILEVYAKPYVPANVTHYPNVSFTLQEINNINRYASDVYDYVFQQLTKWLLEGGVSDAEWNAYISQLNRMGLDNMMGAFQSAYERYLLG